jgi:hypothetical protein
LYLKIHFLMTTLTPKGRGTRSQVWFACKASYSIGAPLVGVGERTTDKGRLEGESQRGGRREDHAVNGPKDTNDLSRNHWVDVPDVPVEGNGVIHWWCSRKERKGGLRQRRWLEEGSWWRSWLP